MKILLIDNYDSFTYNLYQYIGELLEHNNSAFSIEVKRNNEISIQEIKKQKFNRIIISPGPGSPDDPAYFGVCADVLLKVGQKIPVFGVCLGMQGMAYFYGGKVIRAQVPMHGKFSTISHDGKGIFTGLPQNIQVMRYHSLVADPTCLPKELQVTAVVNQQSRTVITDIRDVPFSKKKMESVNSDMLKRVITDTSEIMGLRHKKYPIEGIQFHPESFATEGGKEMLSNFLFQ